MAITYIGAGAAQQGSTVVTVPVPAGYGQNDLLVMCFACSAVPTLSGWTNVGTATSGIYCIFYKFASASESSVSVTLGNAAYTAQMFAYRGANTFNSQSTQGNGTTSPMIFNAFTTTLPNCLVISFGLTTNIAVTMSTPAGTNARANIAGTTSKLGYLVCDYLLAATGTTGPKTSTLSVSTSWGTTSAAFGPYVYNTGDFFFMF